MADWNKPALADLYQDYLDLLKARDVDLAKMFDGVTLTNPQTGFVKWSSANNRWEKYNGATWDPLSVAFALALGSGSSVNATPIGATTASTAKFTTLESSGLTKLGTAGRVLIGNATDDGASALQVNGTVTFTTQATGDNSTKGATTAFVKAQAYATLASPALTGTPTAPTAAVDTNTTQLATTAFVIGQGYAKLASPTLTGLVTVTGGLAVTNSSASPTVSGATIGGNAKNQISLLLGTGNMLGAGVNEYGGALRFNGSSVLWGDVSFYPTAALTDGGQFRLSTTGSALNTTPSASLGVGSLYAASKALIGQTTDDGTNKLQVGGSGRFAGHITASTSGATDTYMVLEANAGRYRGLFLRSGTVNRWGMFADNTVEGGSNAGSNLLINSYADNGSYIATPLSIVRSTGVATFGQIPVAPTAAVDTNTTQLATTAFVIGQGYAKLASPALTGTPTAPTAPTATNTTQIATTAFVKAQGYAPLASPPLTGTPTAPTAAPGTATTQIATTAFVGAAMQYALNIPIRQTVLSAPSNTSGDANFLSAPTGILAGLRLDSTLTDESGLQTWAAGGGENWDAINKKFGTASAGFNGTSQYLEAAHGPALGSIPTWTVQGWFRLTSSAAWRTIFYQSNAGAASPGAAVLLQLNASNRLYMWLSSGGSSWNIVDSAAGTYATLNQWSHWAITFDGFTYRAFLDGVLAISVSSSLALYPCRNTRLGIYAAGSYFAGQMDDFSVHNQCLYTATFTPPATQFNGAVASRQVDVNAYPEPVRLAFSAGFGDGGGADYVGKVDVDASVPLLAQATNYIYADRDPSTGAITLGATPCYPQYVRGIGRARRQALLSHFDSAITDEYSGNWSLTGSPTISSAQSKFGGNSLSLPGGANGLLMSDGPALKSLGAFTISGWFRRTEVGTTKDLFSFGNSTHHYGLLVEMTSASNKPTLYVNGIGPGSAWDVINIGTPSTPAWVANQWYHLAVVFDGYQYRMYQDGVLGLTVNSAIRPAATGQIALGYWPVAPSQGMAGFVDEFAVHPCALYSGSSFTPPVAPHNADQVWPVFSLAEMKMYDVGAASTERQRVMLGEAVVANNAVVSVVNYPTQRGVGPTAVSGYGQRWQLVQRWPGFLYDNDTGRPITVSLRADGNNATTLVNATVDGVSFAVAADNSANYPAAVGSFSVPAGATYSYSVISGTAGQVYELR